MREKFMVRCSWFVVHGSLFMVRTVLCLVLVVVLFRTTNYEPPTIYAQVTKPIGVNLSGQYGFGWIDNAGQLFSKVIPIVFYLSSLIVFFYFLWAGAKYIYSSGNKEEIAKARAMIINSIVGFLLLMFVFLLAQVIPEAFGLKGFRIL